MARSIVIHAVYENTAILSRTRLTTEALVGSAKPVTSVQIQSHAGVPIHSFDDWERYALPAARRDIHWEQDRSAYELGRIWTAGGEPAVPLQLAQLLECHQGTKGIVILSGITEWETPLPFGSRGPRCHDLALLGRQDGSAVTICIEAKADEPFGGTVTRELSNARKRAETRKGGHTRFPERLDWLTRSLLGVQAFKDDQLQVLAADVANLPYQLLPAIAGTLLEGEHQKASKAVFVVHEFRTAKTVDAKLDANADVLNGFLRLFLSSNGASIEEDFSFENGHILGPILVTQHPVSGADKIPCDIPLFVGKIRTDLLAG